MNAKKFWIFIILFAVSLIWQESARGFHLLDGKLSIGGYLRNDFGVRLQDGQRGVHPGWDAGDLYLFRNTLQLEIDYDMTEHLKLYAIYRGWYDASMDFDKDIHDPAAT